MKPTPVAGYRLFSWPVIGRLRGGEEVQRHPDLILPTGVSEELVAEALAMVDNIPEGPPEINVDLGRTIGLSQLVKVGSRDDTFFAQYPSLAGVAGDFFRFVRGRKAAPTSILSLSVHFDYYPGTRDYVYNFRLISCWVGPFVRGISHSKPGVQSIAAAQRAFWAKQALIDPGLHHSASVQPNFPW